MNKTTRAIVFAVFMLISLHPRTTIAAVHPNTVAACAFGIFLVGTALILTSAFQFGKSGEKEVLMSCPQSSKLVCCSMSEGTFLNCKEMTEPCPDKKGPVCLPTNLESASTFPAYHEKKMDQVIAFASAVIGLIAVGISFGLYKLPLGHQTGVMPGVHRLANPPPAYRSTSSMPPPYEQIAGGRV